MELYEQYKREYSELVTITDMNLDDRAKRIPYEKHIWISRMTDAKIVRMKLFKKKRSLRNDAISKLIKESPVAIVINKKILDDIDNSTNLTDINEKIQDYDFLIEYLELTIKAIMFIAQDIKNIILLKEMREL